MVLFHSKNVGRRGVFLTQRLSGVGVPWKASSRVPVDLRGHTSQ